MDLRKLKKLIDLVEESGIAEIEADRAGVVKKILITDGQPVEYGEPLFIIE